jgi:PhzF family phenazine biosynthesis protein
MRARIYKLDSFTTKLFSGNPAAVLPLESFLDDTTMQAIAAENNLAETAFFVREGNDFRLRWFTPTVEVPFCGHATLASAAVVMERLEPGRARVVFHSRSGPLTVERRNGAYLMDFPARQLTPLAPGRKVADALGTIPVELCADNLNNYVALLDSAQRVRDLTPRLDAILQLACTGVIVTAHGDDGYDFVSRYFAPAKGIPEDPVTGGAHCALTPFWARKLGRSEFHAYQASRRGGSMRCRLAGDRVEIEGRCVFYLQGDIEDLGAAGER